MSEKQFQIIHLGNPYEFVVKDNTTNKTYGPFEGDEKSMSDLLNDQQDKISELEEELEKSSAFIIEQRKENKSLKEENEELRKENKDLNDIEWEKFKKKYHLE